MKVKAWIQTGTVGSKVAWTIDIPDDEFREGMTDGQRNNIIGDYVYDQLNQHFEWGWEEVE